MQAHLKKTASGECFTASSHKGVVYFNPAYTVSLLWSSGRKETWPGEIMLHSVTLPLESIGLMGELFSLSFATVFLVFNLLILSISWNTIFREMSTIHRLKVLIAMAFWHCEWEMRALYQPLTYNVHVHSLLDVFWCRLIFSDLNIRFEVYSSDSPTL